MSTGGSKVILITRATDGLGKQVACDLAACRITVLLHGRDWQKGQAVLQESKRPRVTTGTRPGFRMKVVDSAVEKWLYHKDLRNLRP
jgi:NADP-dependent 3-hydroxy acid dehydrogenase YdfG